MIRGATWSPAYDLRVDTETDSISCTYFGRVTQSTTEDWEGTFSAGCVEAKTSPVHRRRTTAATYRPTQRPTHLPTAGGCTSLSCPVAVRRLPPPPLYKLLAANVLHVGDAISEYGSRGVIGSAVENCGA